MKYFPTVLLLLLFQPVYANGCDWDILTPDCHKLAIEEAKGATKVEDILFPMHVYNALWVKAELCRSKKFIANLITNTSPSGAASAQAYSAYLMELAFYKAECFFDSIILLEDKVLKKLVNEELIDPLLGEQEKWEKALNSNRGNPKYQRFYIIYDKLKSNKQPNENLKSSSISKNVMHL